MPKLVIYLLEMVEIQNDDRQVIVLSLCSGDLFPETLFSVPAVVQACEGIEDSQAVEFVRSLTLRDRGLQLLPEPLAKELELAMLVKHIAVRDQHQGDQPLYNHGCVVAYGVWPGKHHHRNEEQDQRPDSIAPEPESAPVQVDQALPDLPRIGDFLFGSL